MGVAPASCPGKGVGNGVSVASKLSISAVGSAATGMRVGMGLLGVLLHSVRIRADTAVITKIATRKFLANIPVLENS